MDTTAIIDVVTNVPFMAVLLYLLIKEQQSHLETRKERDREHQEWLVRYAALAERVAQAVERLDLPGPM